MKIEPIKGGTLPQRMTSGAVGYDCFAREVKFKQEREWKQDGYKQKGATINLGFKIDTSVKGKFDGPNLPIEFGAFLFPRSGWARKYGFKLKNTIGVIDPDYRGEVIAEVKFDECPPELLYWCQARELEESDDGRKYHPIDPPRVCQMVFLPCYVGELTQVDRLDETERGEGGFGSTKAW